MSAGAPRLGRGVTAVGLPALVALTASWLFLGAGPVRTALLWTFLTALALCVLTVTAHVLRTGRITARHAYDLALDGARAPRTEAPPRAGARRDSGGARQEGNGVRTGDDGGMPPATAAPGAPVPAPAPAPAPVPVPTALRGSRWTWARITAVALAVPTALVLFSSLGAGVPDRSPTAARIAGATHVIKELPVVAVDHVERAGSSSRSASEADYTVRLPAPDGGRGVPATFRAEVPRGVRAPGDTLFVAYAPERPEWGAVGAVRRADVDAQLVGRTLSDGSTLTFAVLWTIAAAAMVGTGTAITGPPRRARRVDESWVALRATANGLTEHAKNDAKGAVEGEAESEEGNQGKSEERNQDENEGDRGKRATADCLTLHTAAGPVPLRLEASHRRAVPLLTGAEGWLLWKPAGGGGKSPEAGAAAATAIAGGKARGTAGSDSQGKVLADFVADDGWQLPGRIPGTEADRIAAVRPNAPFPLDAARRTRLLEFGSHWPRTVPVGALLGLILSVAAVGALLLPVDGGWRVWTALAGALAPLVLWMTTGRVTPPSEQPATGQAATGRAAHSGEGTGNEDRSDRLTR